VVRCELAEESVGIFEDAGTLKSRQEVGLDKPGTIQYLKQFQR
jgi:hypothetical protein